MVKALAIAMIILTGVVSGRDLCAQQRAGPVLKVVEGDSLELGKLYATRGEYQAFYHITNLGLDTLRFRIYNSGGAIISIPLGDVVAPGDTVVVQIAALPRSYPPGRRSQMMTISSNDASQETKTVRIWATIVHELQVQPPYLLFLRDGTDREISSRCVIHCTGDSMLTIGPPAFGGGNIFGTLRFDITEPHVLRPGDSLAFTAFYTSQNPMIGDSQLHGSVELSTSSEFLPIIQINLMFLTRREQPK